MDAPAGQRETSSSVNPVTDSVTVNVMVSVWPALITPEPARERLTVGTTPSTFCAACARTAEWVSVALFPNASAIVPEFNANEFAVIAKPSVSVSPATTV